MARVDFFARAFLWDRGRRLKCETLRVGKIRVQYRNAANSPGIVSSGVSSERRSYPTEWTAMNYLLLISETALGFALLTGPRKQETYWAAWPP